ncbi:hypothetical protein OFY17_10330 [Marinomonas sp. C2222]|uniref:Uncharacterized protein n=1 Tax=Marinomonas sargassi TaxID=2984494 RepID=A0ABT2YTQ3_9GAMM|nr:hypothetical protein [Marinomonas sargassi]MCV2403276.1 hypothetical protein [Marinomonas sargassi]
MFKPSNRIKHQQGWIILEVLLCLFLLAVVLQVVERQSHRQWSSIQISEDSKKRAENDQNQEVFEHLIGENLASEDVNTLYSYPNCDLCSGEELKQWFYASQYSVSSADEGISP